MSSKVYEEAIADAKKLRDVAEENAKKAILEAVTPRIREFIEGQLLEGSDEDTSELDSGPFNVTEEEETEMSEDVVLDESALRSLVEMLGGSEILASLQEGNEVLNDSIRHAVDNLSESERQKLFNLADKINESSEQLASMGINNNENSIQENEEMKNEKFYEVDLRALREQVEQELTSELDDDPVEERDDGLEETLEDELMREIKLMLDLGEEIEEDDLPEDLLSMLVDEEDDEEGEVDEEEGDLEDMEGMDDLEDMEGMEDLEDLPELGDEEEAPPEDLQEVFDVDPRVLRQELARVRRQLREGKGIAKDMEHHFGGKGKSNAGVKKSFGGGAEGKDAFESPPQINKLNEAIRNLRRKNRAQQEKLTKYRSAVQTLREQLEDLNLTPSCFM